MFGWPVDWVVAVLQLQMLETKCSPGPARRSVRAGCAIILAHLGVLGRNVHHQKINFQILALLLHQWCYTAPKTLSRLLD